MLPIIPFLLAITLWTTQSNAARTAYVPPMRVVSGHGGVMSGKQCIGAGMLLPSHYQPGDDGVRSSNHQFFMNFQNVSSAQQELKIYLLSGSGSLVSHSDGATKMITGTIGINYTTNSDMLLATETINGFDTLRAVVTAVCSSDRCKIYYQDDIQSVPVQKHNEGTGADIQFFACGSSTPHICFTHISDISFRFEITQNKGAMIAHVNSNTGRCHGLMDLQSSPPPSIAVNGGRPF